MNVLLSVKRALPPRTILNDPGGYARSSMNPCMNGSLPFVGLFLALRLLLPGVPLAVSK